MFRCSFAFILVLLLVSSCSRKDKYDISRYYDREEQDSLLARVVTYLYVAPDGVSMKDRFKPEHYPFYAEKAKAWSFISFYRDDNGKCYYYIERPATKVGEFRGAGGAFNVAADGTLTQFREVFVTPVLSDAEVRGRCTFIFKKMVEGDVEKYLTMQTYVFWPNEATYYDTVTYEWKLRPGLGQ